jgi:AcrR family transcriptional regulator
MLRNESSVNFRISKDHLTMHTPIDVRSQGQRERNKIEKLHRIKEAARELFISKGFDDTTTREIALRAGVGIGTVFIYADNKRDLLFLVANEELEAITSKAEASIRDDVSCLQNLLTVFRFHYEFFARQPELSRLMLREMIFYDSGRQAARFHTTRERVIRVVGSIMKKALDGGAIDAAEDPGFIGWVAFCIYQVELRRWLASKDLDLNEGVAELRRALELLMNGLKPTREALRVSQPRCRGQRR